MLGILDWISRFQIIQDALSSKFTKTIIMPVVYAMITGVTGILGGVPLMWVLMAAALAFAGVITGILRTSEYRERKHPANKIRLIQVNFTQDLTYINFPNRQQRRSNQIIQRTIEKAQLGVLLTNDAPFPISIILESATTLIEGKAPPRSTFPRPSSIVYPGTMIVLADDAIEMLKLDCKNLTGSLDMVIRYGYPGKENIKMEYNATVYIMMQASGFVTTLYTNWKNKSSPPPAV